MTALRCISPFPAAFLLKCETLQNDYALEEDHVRVIEVKEAMLGYICREMERIDWKYGMRLWVNIDNGCYQYKH